MFKNIFSFDQIMVGATKNIFSVAPTIFTISQTAVASALTIVYTLRTTVIALTEHSFAIPSLAGRCWQKERTLMLSSGAIKKQQNYCINTAAANKMCFANGTFPRTSWELVSIFFLSSPLQFVLSTRKQT
jgi:hypothetical protein